MEDHYKEAFYEGTKDQLAEVEAIIASGEPTFENTIVALEKSGQILTRMLLVFYNKSSSDTSDNLDAIEEEIAPKLSAHQDAITLNPALFSRIKHSTIRRIPFLSLQKMLGYWISTIATSSMQELTSHKTSVTS